MRRWGRILWVETGRGEVDEPKIVKGANMESQGEVAQKGAEDVAGPDAGQWQFPSWLRFLAGRFGEM